MGFFSDLKEDIEWKIDDLKDDREFKIAEKSVKPLIKELKKHNIQFVDESEIGWVKFVDIDMSVNADVEDKLFYISCSKIVNDIPAEKVEHTISTLYEPGYEFSQAVGSDYNRRFLIYRFVDLNKSKELYSMCMEVWNKMDMIYSSFY